jgi:hypothetical protein
MKEKHLALLDTEEAKLVSQPVLGELGQETRSSHGNYAGSSAYRLLGDLLHLVAAEIHV